jgi:hypothetical protein
MGGGINERNYRRNDYYWDIHIYRMVHDEPDSLNILVRFAERMFITSLTMVMTVMLPASVTECLSTAQNKYEHTDLELRLLQCCYVPVNLRATSRCD